MHLLPHRLVVVELLLLRPSRDLGQLAKAQLDAGHADVGKATLRKALSGR